MANGWLPRPFNETDCEIEVRYATFRRDYIEQPPDVFAPKAFKIDARIREGREEAFYHLTTTGGDDRRHDPYRCGRIHWGKPIIERVDSGSVQTWRIRQNGESRIKIALHNFQYLVVLAEHGASVRLVTAFYVHDGHYRKRLQKESRRLPE